MDIASKEVGFSSSGNPDVTFFIELVERTNKCVCCLTERGPFVNLIKCRHTNFLESVFKLYDAYSTLVCYTCHIQLANITSFRQRVDRSNSILKGQSLKNSCKSGYKQLTQSKIKITSITEENVSTIKVETYDKEESDSASDMTHIVEEQSLDIPAEFTHTAVNESADLDEGNDSECLVKVEMHSDEESFSDTDDDIALSELKRGDRFFQDKNRKLKDNDGTRNVDQNINTTQEIIKVLQGKAAIKKANTKNATKVKNRKVPIQSNITDITLSCKHCDQKFTTKVLLVDHLKTHFPDNSSNLHKCKYCNYEASSRVSIDHHLVFHGFRKKHFVCNICHYKFKSQQILDDHVVKCSKKSPCAPKFSSDPSRHATTNDNDKSYECTFCEYKCRYRYNFTRHMRAHTGDKRYACSICEYKAIDNSDLKRHMRKHTGDKPFACHVCDCKYSIRFQLTRHMRKHTTEKSYACSVCEYTCNRGYYLTRHMKTHTGDKPYACSICDYKCCQSSNLARHIKRHFNI